MQSYRVNYTLLIGLLVGILVAGGAGYGVWYLQMEKNADTFKKRAMEAKAEGNLGEATEQLAKYIGFRPDDAEARMDLAYMNIEVAERALDNRDFFLFQKKREAVKDALYKFPKDDKLRKAYVDLLTIKEHGVLQAFAKETEKHIKTLLTKEPDNAELLSKRAICLQVIGNYREATEHLNRLVGHNPEEDDLVEAFKKDKALAPDDVSNFAMLAGIMIEQFEQRKRADRLIDYMIELNPKSAEAYLARYRYRSILDRGKGSTDDLLQFAKDDLAKAYELDPKDPKVLLALAGRSQQDAILAQKEGDKEQVEQLMEKARGYLREGLESGTESFVFFR